MVVVTNIIPLTNNKFEEVIPFKTLDNVSMWLMGSQLGQLCDNIIKGNDVKENLGNIIFLLYVFAISFVDSTLEACWSKAYDEIKDRKGFLTPEGNFIKDTDPAYHNYVDKNQSTMELK